MKSYVVSFPKDLAEKIQNMYLGMGLLWISGNFQKAEELLEVGYALVKSYEDKLPDGKRFHKGSELFNWGNTMLLQNNSQKIPEAYRKILLAFVEDLLDYDSIEEVCRAPAHESLMQNPFLSEDLIKLVVNQVEERIELSSIPKNPEDALIPIRNQTKAIEQFFEITIQQIEPAILEHLRQKGDKNVRVFVGGNYINFAVLGHIADIVTHFDFVPILPIDFNLSETYDNASYEKLIHDISMLMLEECSYAIFEVTISNGHLMEIERARDFEHLKVILVYQTTELGKKPIITRMLMTKDLIKKDYRNFDELATIINDLNTLVDLTDEAISLYDLHEIKRDLRSRSFLSQNRLIDVISFPHLTQPGFCPLSSGDEKTAPF